MKKTLIALAAVAATGAAFAQSTVTIGGILEVAPIRSTKVTTQASPTAASVAVKGTNTAQGNTWSTSILNINGSEDLGGGLRASFVLISGAGQGAADTGIGARERTLALSGGFGTVRFGRFVPAASAGFHGFSNTGSATLAGSSYGLSTSSSAAAPNALHTNGTMFERQDNVLQYTTPAFSGLTANVAIADNKSDSDAAAAAGKTAYQQTSLHLGYAAGPLGLGLGLNRAKGNVEAAPAVAATVVELPGDDVFVLTGAGSAAVVSSSTKSDLNWVGASYNLGVASVAAHYVTRKGSATTAAGVTTTGTDIKVTGLGVAVPMGAFTLRASMYSGKDKQSALTTDNRKVSGHQVSAVYALSKRTSVIAATGTNQFKPDGATSTASLRKTTQNTLAVNHTF